MSLALPIVERETEVAATLKVTVNERHHQCAQRNFQNLVIYQFLYHGYKYYSETNVQTHLLIHKKTSHQFNCIPPNATPLQFPKTQEKVCNI